MTWKKDVLNAMLNLNKDAHLDEIYNEVSKIRNITSKEWKAQIRATLERNSSDSEAWEGKDDLFKMIEKGSGVWGLNKTSKEYKSSIGKIFGEVENTEIKVGHIFKNRKDLSDSGLHRPTMNGIWGSEEFGAYSIVLSGGYEDDEDYLDEILYTGQGGRDPNGKQIKDQEFSKGNKALSINKSKRLPVRVVRGHQVENGPSNGYRYDGLYYVNNYKKVKGKSGYFVYRYELSSENKIEILSKDLEFKNDYTPAERAKSESYRIKRNQKIVDQIKEIYDYTCQVCNQKLVTPNGAVCIGAHIKGLGKLHNGPDVIENLLVLCPNHHDLYDNYGFSIDKDLNIVGLNYDLLDNPKYKLIIKSPHKVNPDFLNYHHNIFKEYNI